MRVLVVGGAGYVASLFTPTLTRRHAVRVFDKANGDDALDQAGLVRAMAGIDVVIHSVMTRSNKTADLFDLNVKATHVALAAADKAGVPHAIYISSLSVYDKVTKRVLDESTPADACDAYGLTKRLGETVCEAAAQKWGLTVNILRLAWPTPDNLWPAWKPPWRKGKPIVFKTPRRVPIQGTSATDLGRAIDKSLAYRDGCQTFHITGDTSARLWSTTKAQRLLGWQPRIQGLGSDAGLT